MRQIIPALIVGLATIWASPAIAVELPDGGRFGASASISENEDFCAQTGGSATCDKRDFGWKFYGGYQFQKFFAVEGALVDLGQASTQGPGGALGDISVAETSGVSIAGVFTAPVLITAGIFIKIGGIYWDQDREVATTGLPSVTSNEQGGSLLLGGGFRFPLSDRLGMAIEYEKYYDVGTTTTGKSDFSVYSLGLFWHFGSKSE